MKRGKKEKIKVGDYVDYTIRAKVVDISSLGIYELDVPHQPRWQRAEENEIAKSKEQ